MANDKRYTDLPVATSIASDDIMAMVDVNGNITYQFTFAQLMTFLSQNYASGANFSYGTINPQNTTGANGDVFLNTSSNQFLQKISGAWTSIYTFPSSASLDGTVLYGIGAPDSGTGNNNDTYVDTSAGIFYKKASGSWSVQFTIASGPAGARGNSILNGTADPQSTDGQNGDFWINTTSHVLWGPKASGAWPGTGFSLAPQTPNTLLNGTIDPSNGTGNNGDFYINTSTFKWFGPKASGAWPAGIVLGGGSGSTIDPQDVPVNAGSAIPYAIDFTSLRTTYGDEPIIEVYQVMSVQANTPSSGHTTTTKRPVFDVPVDFIDVDGALSTLNVYGHDKGDGSNTTMDNLIIRIRQTQ